MDYEEATEYKPTELEIERELKRHGATLAEFRADIKKKRVTGKDVLGWLGY